MRKDRPNSILLLLSLSLDDVFNLTQTPNPATHNSKPPGGRDCFIGSVGTGKTNLQTSSPTSIMFELTDYQGTEQVHQTLILVGQSQTIPHGLY